MLQGDAEDLPFPDDAFDRYVSAGSIEYWPGRADAVTNAAHLEQLSAQWGILDHPI